MEDPQYPYGEAYQTKIAALIARDPSFLTSYKDVVNPDYFENPHLATIVRLVSRHLEHYKELPTRDTLMESISAYSKNFTESDALMQSIYESVDRVYRADISDARSLADGVIKFGQIQAIRQEIIWAMDEIDSPGADPQKIQARMLRAGRVGHGVGQSGINLATVMPRMRDIVESSSSYAQHKKISTGVDQWDNALQGGPGRGEVHCVLGTPAGGKSMALLNVCHNAIIVGYFGIYITIGDLDEDDVALRFASRMTGVPMLSLIQGEGYAEYNQKVEQLVQRNFNLQIKYYPAGRPTIETIVSYVYDQISIHGRNPDIVVIDYADKISMPRGDNTFLGMADIYTDLQNLAREVDAVVWTASQVQRRTNNPGEIIGQESIDKSWEKAALADGVYSINQSKIELDMNFARLYCAKVRRGATHHHIPLYTDWSRALMLQGAWPQRGEE